MGKRGCGARTVAADERRARGRREVKTVARQRAERTGPGLARRRGRGVGNSDGSHGRHKARPMPSGSVAAFAAVPRPSRPPLNSVSGPSGAASGHSVTMPGARVPAVRRDVGPAKRQRRSAGALRSTTASEHALHARIRRHSLHGGHIDGRPSAARPPPLALRRRPCRRLIFRAPGRCRPCFIRAGYLPRNQLPGYGRNL